MSWVYPAPVVRQLGKDLFRRGLVYLYAVQGAQPRHKFAAADDVADTLVLWTE